MGTPETLYQLTIKRLADHAFPREILRLSLEQTPEPNLPVEMQFDICFELSKWQFGASELLYQTLTNSELFLQFLQLNHKRMKLHKVFEAVNAGETREAQPVDKLTLSLTSQLEESPEVEFSMYVGAISFSTFLLDAGWFRHAIKLLRAMNGKSFIGGPPNCNYLSEINAKLLRAFCEFRDFENGKMLLTHMLKDNKELSSVEKGEISNFYYVRSLYPESYLWGEKAVESIGQDTPNRVLIDVLRYAGNSHRYCVLL